MLPPRVAGWHLPTGCLQPWATATGPVPALPRTSFENVSEAALPAAARGLLVPVFLWGHPLCVQSASDPVQEDSVRATRPLLEIKEGPSRAERRGALDPVRCVLPLSRRRAGGSAMGWGFPGATVHHPVWDMGLRFQGVRPGIVRRTPGSPLSAGLEGLARRSPPRAARPPPQSHSRAGGRRRSKSQAPSPGQVDGKEM